MGAATLKRLAVIVGAEEAQRLFDRGFARGAEDYALAQATGEHTYGIVSIPSNVRKFSATQRAGLAAFNAGYQAGYGLEAVSEREAA